jgi:quinol monooxygenase YgiN
VGVVYVVKVEIAPEAERAWDAWNTEHHIPEVLAQPGFLRATKYRLSDAPGGWARYWVLYDVASRAALDAYLAGEEVRRLRGDHLQRFGGSSRLTREILEEVAAVEGKLARSA